MDLRHLVKSNINVLDSFLPYSLKNEGFIFQINLLKYNSLKLRIQSGFLPNYITLLIETAQNPHDVHRETHILSAEMTEYHQRFGIA